MAFSIHLSKEEKQLANSYAMLHSISIGEAFKKAFFEKIEDEYDIKIAEDAYNEYIDNGKRSRPIQEFFKEKNLWSQIFVLKQHQDLKKSL